ncbi:MAG TPA: ParB N-terminal domain-containing protein [Cyclobacteriaceae bacterium]|nr:ParB N-terminal domain-containing protein [Cyclobacteriaceae bacterium]HRJ80685.1 ParB N-terminal domain-containing protein [Cyclobacteriaceae bacterium]
MNKDFSNLLGGAISKLQTDETNIRQNITIREDFKSLIPPLSAEEFQQLEENILKEGVRDPLIIWAIENQFILIDGHNRYSICQRHGLSFPFKQMSFKSDDEAYEWMVKNQLGRRNLSPEQQSYLRGLRYNREKTQGKRSDLTLDQNDLKLESTNTALALAKEYNVSEATIKRDGDFARGIDLIGDKNPNLKEKILKGESPISKTSIQEVAKKPQLADTFLGDTKSSTKTNSKPKASKKISNEEIAKIAFEYIEKEIMVPKAFYLSIKKDITSIDPVEFFITWKEHQSSKSNSK